MGILVKPYEISVWQDVWQGDRLCEQRLGIIGTNEMLYQGRAIEPNLVRNVNGTKKFSFKMYKHFIDTTTGEKVDNPFIDWLISERKVKLKYEKDEDGNDIWYDFIIKDAAENSSNYLYTYQLEDANVQELSKNGFGVTLDAALMNNIGTAAELGAYVMEQTDWSVDGDVTVQTVDEALVYISVPSNTIAKHIKDQTVDENGTYSQGVTLYDDIEFEEATTVLAFYSSCKNKPHRFQFIYSTNGYAKDEDNYAISRKDNRIIDEKDCQYYIDFDNPETTYVVHDTTYDLYLPEGWSVVDQGTGDSEDTTISSWYRGARYGYAQQAVYVPLLEQYCQKFKRDETIQLYDSDSEENKRKNIDLHMSGSDGDISGSFSKTSDIVTGFNGTKATEWAGIKLLLDYNSTDTYEVNYTLTKTGGELTRIGGHNASFDTKFYIYSDADRTNQIGYTTSSYIQVDDTTNPYYITAYYTKKTPSSKDWSPYIFIQPNRGLTTPVNFNITDLTVKQKGDYLGYTTSEFVSPTLIQNCITNHKFESNSGWTITASASTSSVDKGDTINVYGRFTSNNKFITITEDFLNGTYTESNAYIPYMKLLFKKDNQFVLNSGIYDNRTTIKNMPKDEEWVLDYKIINSAGVPCSDSFEVSLGEYIYNTTTGGYNQRSGLVSFSASSPTDFNNGKRVIFKVESTTYDTDSFKKDSKIYLKISPKSGVTTANTDGTSFYIEKIALYRKSLNKDNEIIYPDYEEEHSSAAENWSDKSTLEHKYIYFNAWHVDSDNPNTYTEKDKLPIITKNTLEYSVFKPVYNEGAAKVRTVTAKESNYFNVLQTIAETFEQWLVIDIERETDGSIKPNGKKIHFRNYRGENNYACFRYGVNLKDIQRTKSSKNIVTKLIVKQNSNEFAENGFCTIQRAGANPTGENYIYDFQYYQNTDIMSADEYLATNYYLNNAQGPDGFLWEDGTVTDSEEYNINGYFPRLKKINDSILPINEEIIGLQADLVKRKAELEVAEATYEAAVSGIEQTEENFRALMGVSPKEAQSGVIEEVSDITVTSQDAWCGVDTSERTGYINGIKSDTQSISVALTLDNNFVEEYCEVIADQGATVVELTSGAKKITKNTPYTGLYIKNNWENSVIDDSSGTEVMVARTYKLTYELEWIDGSLENIGCHNSWFGTNFSISVTDKSGEEIASSSSNDDDSICILPTSGDNAIKQNTKYLITVVGTRTPDQPYSPDLWIQPNRGNSTEVTCKISKIKLYKELTSGEAARSYDRTAHIYINATIKLENTETRVARTFEIACVFPADQTSIIVTQPVSVIDTTRSDVQKYLTEYTTYFEKLESSSLEKTNLIPIIANKENAIKEKEAYRKQLFEYKTELNKLFFKRYSRFIQEGTWINEEYVDDEKYYADALSVLYNSCYPQVAYSINVLELSGQPGYELFSFKPGEKTWAIDPEFFGEDYHEEVIITELSEMLDDPSKNNVKVQNFKNQFQDLFQRITATVQQTQYNVGSYEKGAALVEASAAKKSEFITNAINAAQTYLNAGQTVKSGADGITITDDSNAKRQLRLVGGAILFSTEDPKTKETRWRTGLTNEGISADLIKAGKIDTSEIQIMAGDQAAFRWDVYGISAYDALWTDSGSISTVGNVNTNKFVRFDKHGIYGIDGTANGATWHPTGLADDYKDKENPALAEIDDKATFALTWEGLKVTGNNNTIAQLGKQKYNNDDYIMIVKNSNGEPTFTIKNDGSVAIAGNLQIGDAITTTNDSNIMGTANRDGTYKWLFDKDNGLKMWYGNNESNPCFSITGEQLTMNGIIKSGSGNDLGTENSFWIVPDGAKAPLFGQDNDTLWIMTAGNKTGITKDGSIYCSNLIATGGKIGGVEIGEIMPTNANTNNFSWSFDSKKGMFMWNGKQGSGSLTDANLVLGIANTGTASTPNYTLAMKGHVVAESGQIGFLNINKDEKTLEYNDNGNTLWKISQTAAVFPSRVSVSTGVSSSGGYAVISKVISKPEDATWTTSSMPGLFCADYAGQFSGFSSRYIHQYSEGTSREAKIADVIYMANEFKELFHYGERTLNSATNTDKDYTFILNIKQLSFFTISLKASDIGSPDSVQNFSWVIRSVKKITEGNKQKTQITVAVDMDGTGEKIDTIYWFAIGK